jgi:3-oxoacid CoA-transferase B subunit
MMGNLSRDGIAWRIARDLHEGSYVNLGVGIPVLVSNYLDPNQEIFLHSENGILGVGPKPDKESLDLDLISAGKGFCTLALGASLFDQQISFTMMRGGHLTHAILGALEVAENGDFANWKVPGEAVPGVGGAMDLAIGSPNIYVAMTHVSNKGQPKIVHRCAAPLTAQQCVKRIYSDIAVIELTPQGLVLMEYMPGFDPVKIQSMTEASLRVSEHCCEMVIPQTASNGVKLYQS